VTLLTSPRIAAQHTPEGGRRRARRSTPDLAVLVLLVGATVVVGATRLSQPLWLDEVASMRVITAPGVGDVLHLVRTNESNPPLWYLMAHGVDRLVGGMGLGVTVLALRIVSLAESALLVGVTFVWVRRFMSLPQATLAGGILCFGSLLVDHSVELRAYTTLALLLVLSAKALEGASRRPTLARLGILALVDAAGAMTHYFFLLSLAAGVLWVCLTPLRLGTRVRLSLATGVATLPFLLWLPALADQVKAQHFGFIGPFDPHKLVTFWQIVFLQHLHAGRWAADLALVALLLVVVGTRRLLVKPETLLFGLYTVVPFTAAATLWALGQDIFDVRNLIGIAPFAAMAVATALRMRSPVASIVVTVAGVTAMAAVLVSTQLSLHRTPYDTVAARLTEHGWNRGDPVIFFGSPFPTFNPVAWYLPHQPLLVRGRPSTQPSPRCQDVFVVSETPNGQQWLRERRDLLWSAQLPFYGNALEGSREPVSIVVAEIRNGGASLLTSAKENSASLFFEPGAGPGCLQL